jgi:hypothetical protein
MVCCYLLLAGCVEPYAPDVIDAPNQFLVVDGFINGNGPTIITLSRTQNLTEDGPPVFESRAEVLIEEEQGPQYMLTEGDTGTYTVSGLNLNLDRKYRLLIRTADGKEYSSEFVEIKQTPPIDAVIWRAVDNEVQLYVNTHDPENNTRYYRWEYENTWEFTAALLAGVKYENDTIIERSAEDEKIYRCWRTEKSVDLLLASTVRLSEDVIHEFPLQTLPSTSEAFRFDCSILVKQYAQTREAYEYWEMLQKNTENIGTLFDPLPSQLRGNIHCVTNPDEAVIGYIGAFTVQEKRIFINNEELPKEWPFFYPTCDYDTIPVAKVFESFGGSAFLPLWIIYSPPPGSKITGYTRTLQACADCRLRGTNVKPDFWP